MLTAEPARGAGYDSIAVLAGVSGRITTLACYDPNPFVAHPSHPGKPNPWAPCRTVDDSPADGVTGNHSGAHLPTDISNSGGTVWVQLDYLEDAVRGGYIWIEDASTGCFNPSTSGARSRVWIYFYDATGWTDTVAVQYGHIVQSGSVMDTWLYWNNYHATNPMFPAIVIEMFGGYYLHNLTAGGVPIGTVKSNPTGCVTGAHLHQEMYDGSHSESYHSLNYSDGCWYAGGAYQLPCTTSGYKWVTGRPTTGRYTDIHRLNIYVH